MAIVIEFSIIKTVGNVNRWAKGSSTPKGGNLKIKLVFDDWRKQGESVYSTEEGFELSWGDFHSGTTFDGNIALDSEQSIELEKAIKDGYTPVFWVMAEGVKL